MIAPDDALKKILPSWMISGGSTTNLNKTSGLLAKSISRPDSTESSSSNDGPTLARVTQDPPQAKQHNFNGLLHPFFRLRSSLGGKAL